jgi:hypothetical protein
VYKRRGTPFTFHAQLPLFLILGFSLRKLFFSFPLCLLISVAEILSFSSHLVYFEIERTCPLLLCFSLSKVAHPLLNTARRNFPLLLPFGPNSGECMNSSSSLLLLLKISPSHLFGVQTVFDECQILYILTP